MIEQFTINLHLNLWRDRTENSPLVWPRQLATFSEWETRYQALEVCGVKVILRWHKPSCLGMPNFSSNVVAGQKRVQNLINKSGLPLQIDDSVEDDSKVRHQELMNRIFTFMVRTVLTRRADNWA